MKTNTITMEDVAQKAGLSRRSVSGVLNNNPTIKVSERTRRRVLDIANQMHYQPNYFARALKTGRTSIIGIKGAADGYLGLFQPYLTKVYTGIIEYFKEKGLEYRFIFEDFKNLRTGSDTDLYRQGMVDGLLYIVLSRNIDAFIANQVPLLNSAGVPFVAIHSISRPLPCASVGVNCEHAGYIGARHLIEHGYLSLGLCMSGGSINLHEQEMLQGFIRACNEGGLGQAQRTVYSGTGYLTQEGAHFADTLLADRPRLPRALLTTSDSAAYGIIQRLREKGVQVPEDVAVVGFGDDFNQAQIITDLTTVGQPAFKKGHSAAEMLHRMMEQNDPAIGRDEWVLLEPSLKIRKSCGC